MKLLHIANEVFCRPWLITAPAHAKIRDVVTARIATGAKMSADFDPDDIPEKEEVKQFGDTSAICAVIPIHGIIGKGVSVIERTSGMVGVEQIEDDLDAAMENDEVKAILLDVDSPGGSVSGIASLADKIKSAASTKLIRAFTDGQMDSAAYWLGCSASGGILASRDAEVGSIGVYIPWADETAAYEKDGVKMHIIKNDGGAFKGMGYPGTALTEEQMAHLQDRVNDIFKMFTAHIHSQREVSTEAMQGQSFLAADALECNLIDRICTFDEAVRSCLEDAF